MVAVQAAKIHDDQQPQATPKDYIAPAETAEHVDEAQLEPQPSPIMESYELSWADAHDLDAMLMTQVTLSEGQRAQIETASARLAAALRSPSALARSVLRGHCTGSGATDYVLLSSLVRRLEELDASAAITDALAGAISSEADLQRAATLPLPGRNPSPSSRSSGSNSSPASPPQEKAPAQLQGANDSRCVSSPSAVDCNWITAALACSVPLLSHSLPVDVNGVSILPHHHTLVRKEADPESRCLQGGRIIYTTCHVCDRCMEPIHDQVFYQCPDACCDLDFCPVCYEELEGVMDNFVKRKPKSKSLQHLRDRMLWSLYVVAELADLLLARTQAERMMVAKSLAEEWPVALFSELVRAVVDVCNAKMLFNIRRGTVTTSVRLERTLSGVHEYVPEGQDIQMDSKFWSTVGLLQFLYHCNTMTPSTALSEECEALYRIPLQEFVMEGINRCRPDKEWRKWKQQQLSKRCELDMRMVESFHAEFGFRSLVAHSNLLPISFRRHCVLEDVRFLMRDQRKLLKPLVFQVDRCSPTELISEVVAAFARPEEVQNIDTPLDSEQRQDSTSEAPHPCKRHALEGVPPGFPFLCRPVRVGFKGEAGEGPGVQREFFQVAMRTFLGAIFAQNADRSYWFDSEESDRSDAYFSCGALLGQAVLHDVLIPSVFPWPLYDLLLRDLGSAMATPKPTLEQLWKCYPLEAAALQKVLDYEGEDILHHFGDLGWERTGIDPDITLSQATKRKFVDAYVAWSFGPRIHDRQMKPFSQGFQAVLGGSIMIREMMDAFQLERIICGRDEPVDVSALRRRASCQGWTEAEQQEYLPKFWDILASLPEAEKIQFVVFVTASDRVPLRGWEELRLEIQKNGNDDVRLPTAYTCFSLLLLPVYSSQDILRRNLRTAISNSEGFGLQ